MSQRQAALASAFIRISRCIPSALRRYCAQCPLRQRATCPFAFWLLERVARSARADSLVLWRIAFGIPSNALDRARAIFVTQCWGRFPSASHRLGLLFLLARAAKLDQQAHADRRSWPACRRRV